MTMMLPGLMAMAWKPVGADVTQMSANGFQVTVAREVDGTAKVAYRALVDEFAKWYDASHSYSGKPENLSLDLEKACMLEVLPEGGFVRHMEIVFHQPGKTFRMTGGLGPLQGMGVYGALTFAFEEFDGKTRITMTYNVSGAEYLQLDKIAAPVDGVLTSQLDRLASYCDSKDDE